MISLSNLFSVFNTVINSFVGASFFSILVSAALLLGCVNLFRIFVFRGDIE